MQVRTRAFISAAAVLGAVGCGGDDSGGTGGVSSNEKVGDLSAAEAKALCKSLSSKLQQVGDAQTDLVCVAQSAALSGGNADTCESSVGQCKEQYGDDLTIDCETDGETGVSDACNDVTVGELNDCLDATIAALDAVSKKVTCSTPLSDLQDLSTSFETPAACTKIDAKCPDVADMGSP